MNKKHIVCFSVVAVVYVIMLYHAKLSKNSQKRSLENKLSKNWKKSNSFELLNSEIIILKWDFETF